MIYVVLASGREYLFIGDTAWHMDGVRNIKGKDAPWIQEDETTLISQLSWLNGLSKSEKNLFIIAGHDNEQGLDLIKPAILGSKWDVPVPITRLFEEPGVKFAPCYRTHDRR